MHDIFQIAVGTVTMRPYVFAFLAAYLVSAVLHLGWRTVCWFTVIGYLIAFASEVCSINTGFPYGWYYYIDATKDRELWLAGVPFFDSLSYVFLAYCSYATALFALSPIKAWRWDVVTLETRTLRKSLPVLFLGSLFQVFLDIIIDPVALQGSRWFLGQIYGYRETGIHFGVPLSNYLGWWLAGFCMILALQRIDERCSRGTEKPAGVGNFAFRSLMGPLLYLCVVVFNLAIAASIGEGLMAVTGVFIMLLPVAMIVTGAISRANRYGREDLGGHMRDYPWSAVVRVTVR